MSTVSNVHTLTTTLAAGQKAQGQAITGLQVMAAGAFDELARMRDKMATLERERRDDRAFIHRIISSNSGAVPRGVAVEPVDRVLQNKVDKWISLTEYGADRGDMTFDLSAAVKIETCLLALGERLAVDAPFPISPWDQTGVLTRKQIMFLKNYPVSFNLLDKYFSLRQEAPTTYDPRGKITAALEALRIDQKTFDELAEEQLRPLIEKVQAVVKKEAFQVGEEQVDKVFQAHPTSYAAQTKRRNNFRLDVTRSIDKMVQGEPDVLYRKADIVYAHACDAYDKTKYEWGWPPRYDFWYLSEVHFTKDNYPFQLAERLNRGMYGLTHYFAGGEVRFEFMPQIQTRRYENGFQPNCPGRFQGGQSQRVWVQFTGSQWTVTLDDVERPPGTWFGLRHVATVTPLIDADLKELRETLSQRVQASEDYSQLEDSHKALQKLAEVVERKVAQLPPFNTKDLDQEFYVS